MPCRICVWLPHQLPLLCFSHTELLSFPQSSGPLRAFARALYLKHSFLSFTWFVPTDPSSVGLITLSRKPSFLMPPTQDGQAYFRSPPRIDWSLNGDMTLEEVKWQSIQARVLGVAIVGSHGLRIQTDLISHPTLPWLGSVNISQWLHLSESLFYRWINQILSTLALNNKL